LKEADFSNVTFANFDASAEYPYGVCSTPVLYYLGQDDFDLGVAFTASHNPPGDVGMKFFDKNVTLLSTDMLREIFEKEYVEKSSTTAWSPSFKKEDKILIAKVQQLYAMLDKKWSGLKKRHNFVVDFSNGAAVSVEKKFFQDYVSQNHTLYMINDLPD